MLYQITSYLKFLLKSTNQYGIHSPFVYDLVTKCFYDTTKYPEYDQLSRFRTEALGSDKTIHVVDFGQGSRVFNSNTRKVGAIAKHAGISEKRQRLLFRLVHYFKCNNTLELGTSVGLATIALSLGSAKGHVITIEGCEETAKIAQQFFDRFSVNNITLHQKRFKSFLADSLLGKFDLIYIDGNHNKEQTLFYFNELLTNVTPNSIVLFDDIYWSKSMNEAWKEICNNPKVTVSIDAYFWGFIFFRTEQQKQHFTIRL